MGSGRLLSASSRVTTSASPTQAAWCSRLPSGEPPTTPAKSGPTAIDDRIELSAQGGQDQHLLGIGVELGG